MKHTKRIAVLAATGAVVAGGAGVAVAATQSGGDKQHQQAVLDDAAKRLNVTPQQLRDALSSAEDAQLDQAVKDGKLTQAQADAIKQRRADSGRVLGGLGRGGPGRFGGRGFGGALGGVADDVAKAVGLTRAQLVDKLRAGDSLEDVAKAQGKTVADVKAAVRAAVKTRLDQAVTDGDLTQARADDILDRLSARLDDLVSRDLGGRAFGVPFGRHHP